MADDAQGKPIPSENQNGASPNPQIQIMPKPEALKVDLTKSRPQVKPAEAVAIPKPEAKPVPTPTPAPQPAPTAPQGEDENVFTQLFGDDKVMQSANLMQSVNKQKDQAQKSAFGKNLSVAGVKEAAKEKTKSKSHSGRKLMNAALLIFALSAVFFYTQNSAKFGLFGANPAQKVQIAAEELQDVQAEIIVQRQLTSILLLDQFSGLADAYLYNLEQSESSVNSSNKRAEFSNAADQNYETIVALLDELKVTLSGTIEAEQKVASNTLVSELIGALEEKSGEVDEESLNQDIQDLQNARSLIQNDGFRQSVIQTDNEALDANQIASLLEAYNELNQSTYAVIDEIQDTRTEWSLLFSEIETLTKKVDPLFNTEFPGSIHLDDLRFDGGVITIAGKTTTDDTKNFTLISNLIDTLEASSNFTNVEERSYSKNESQEDFVGQFRISLDIENHEK